MNARCGRHRVPFFGVEIPQHGLLHGGQRMVNLGERVTLTDHARLAAAIDLVPMAKTVDIVLLGSIQSNRYWSTFRNMEWSGMSEGASPMRRVSSTALRLRHPSSLNRNC
ncbi:MAG: hypothetical protein F4X44_12450 [Gammaproteobacteria bacterium]|nr:hypothetical protein [Gammaproteobacteria bacterium]MYD81410.1 hypothetical protein [Gammaproteobacteria bacterium]